MVQDKHYFLDFLAGHGTNNVLFEPFLHRRHAETLIWRRGEHLWNTADAYVETLVALSHRTKADVVFCDMRIFADTEKMFRSMETYSSDNGIGFGVICNTPKDLALAEKSSVVCLAAVYGNAQSRQLPIIRMDGTLADAITRGDAGWYAADKAEQHLKEADGRIRILGGLGPELILHSSPVKIYAEVERLAAEYPGQWACGSGFEIPEEYYLELISLLGAFGRIRF